MTCFQRGILGAVIAFGGLLTLSVTAGALTPKPNEKAKLKACEAQLCGVILNKGPADGAISCDISKTWEKSKIVDGVKEKKISWTFGDARCGLPLKLQNATVVSALTKPAHDLVFDAHQISCQIERSEGVTDVKIEMAPKISFKDGKAHKAWLNVKKIEAPTVIKGAIWTVSKLEDNLGLFHGQIIDEINEFMHKKCAKRYKNKK